MYERKLSYEDMIGTMEFDLFFAMRDGPHYGPPVSLADVEDISRSCPRLAAEGVNLDKVSELLACALEYGGRDYCANLLFTLAQNTTSLTTSRSRNNTQACGHHDDDDPALAFDTPKRTGRAFVMSAGVAGFEDLPGYREPVQLIEQAFRETFSLSDAGQVLCSPFSVSERDLLEALSTTPLLFLNVLQRVLCSDADMTRSSIWHGLIAPSDDDDASDAITERLYLMVAVDDYTEGDDNLSDILASGRLHPATAAVWPPRMRAFCQASACFGRNEAEWFSAPVSLKSLLLQKLYDLKS